MGDLLFILVMLFMWWCFKAGESYKTENRKLPPGYELDWQKISEDSTKYGKSYVYKKMNAGLYDKKIK